MRSVANFMVGIFSGWSICCESRQRSANKVFREQHTLFGPEQTRLLVGLSICSIRKRTYPSAFLALGCRVSWLDGLKDLAMQIEGRAEDAMCQ